MKYYLLLGASVLMLASCSQWSHSGVNKYKVPNNYQAVIDQKVGAELVAEANARRAPANEGWQLQTLKAQLGDFNKIRPGKFEIYVFPKLQTLTHKEIGEEGVLLGKPQIAEVSVLAVSSCDFMITKHGFAKHHPAKYFDPKLATNKDGKCAIISVASRSMKTLNRSYLREGDVLAKRLYFDDKYNVYGVEVDQFSKGASQSPTHTMTVGFKMTAGTPTTSGLDFLPVDMPAMGRIQKLDSIDFKSLFAVSSKKTDFAFKTNGVLLDRMALRQIGRMNRNFKIPSCSMRMLSYKDLYRKPVDMYWCEGLPWPQVVNSLQFVAVTQNLSVR